MNGRSVNGTEKVYSWKRCFRLYVSAIFQRWAIWEKWERATSAICKGKEKNILFHLKSSWEGSPVRLKEHVFCSQSPKTWFIKFWLYDCRALYVWYNRTLQRFEKSSKTRVLFLTKFDKLPVVFNRTMNLWNWKLQRLVITCLMTKLLSWYKHW